MKILVQKFGGTSLSTPEARELALGHIIKARKSGSDVVAVFSAIGRFPDPYATDTLLKLIRKDSGGEHKDLLSSCGEVISTVVMADLLESRGENCEILALDKIGILTDDQHEDAEILEINPEPVLSVLRKGMIAVVAGFQGVTSLGKVTTLGRGGSDITATALGAALKAELVEIYKDVDAVFSADPRIVPDASTITEITFQEIGEMAYLGAKVLHPKAVSFAMEHRIPIRIRSNFSENGGTLVFDKIENPRKGIVEFKNVVSGIAHIPNMAYVQVKLEDPGDLGKARHDLFKIFAHNGISLDLITVNSQGVYFIIHESEAGRAQKLLSESGLEFHIESGFAKVSVVGAGMRGKPGVMFRVVEALHLAGIPLYHSTDSHITIACLVKQSDMEKAIRALHDAFIAK